MHTTTEIPLLGNYTTICRDTCLQQPLSTLARRRHNSYRRELKTFWF